MAMGVSANKLELLQIADAVAREKGIDARIVLEAMADSIQKAAKARYGVENDIRAEINSKTGDTILRRFVEVVDVIENECRQTTLEAARDIKPDIQLGEFLTEVLPPVEFGRAAVQVAKQVIFNRVREAERERQYEEFKGRIGEIASGIVKRVEYGNVIVDLGRGEAMLRRDQLIARETFSPNDRIRAYIQDVQREDRSPQIILSRTVPAFMAKLFWQEVPEIYDGIVEIRAVARDPGSRAKIAVVSNDNSIDPVGACVGMRGSRVQAVVNELQGEKVDIIPWSPDIANFVVNALSPAEVTKVVLDEDIQHVVIVVPDEQLSLAIGRRGQNVRMASQLTGWDIDIQTETDESARRQSEFSKCTEEFMKMLDVDEMIAQLLASEGFSTAEEVAYVHLDDITSIEGFDESTAEELQYRAKESIERHNKILNEERKTLGVSDDLLKIDGLTVSMLVALGKNDVLSLEDFAGCIPDDLVGWYDVVDRQRVRQSGILDDFDISKEMAEKMVMVARVKVGWIQEEDLVQDSEEGSSSES